MEDKTKTPRPFGKIEDKPVEQEHFPVPFLQPKAAKPTEPAPFREPSGVMPAPPVAAPVVAEKPAAPPVKRPPHKEVAPGIIYIAHRKIYHADLNASGTLLNVGNFDTLEKAQAAQSKAKADLNM